MIIEEIKQKLFPNESFHLEQNLKNNKKNFRVAVLNKGTPKERVIFIPKKITKYCQRFILKEYLSELKPSDYCISYRKGFSIRKNASKHKQGKYFLHLDIKHFFNNMIWKRFCEIVNNNYQETRLCKAINNPDDNAFLRRVLTYKNRIVQGSVTSPYISNLYLIEFDMFVHSYIVENDLDWTYTRYSDDIYFSSKKYIDHNLIDILDSKLKEQHLRLNFSKINFTKLKSSVRLTGLSLKKNKRIVVPTKFKKKMKNQIYKFLVKREGDKNMLMGELSFLKTNDYAYYKKMCNKYTDSSDLIMYIKNN